MVVAHKTLQAIVYSVSVQDLRLTSSVTFDSPHLDFRRTFQIFLADLTGVFHVPH